MDSSDRIRALRKGNGWTQEKLANLLNLTPQGISNIENRRQKPTLQTLEKLAELTGVNVDWILTGNGEKFRQLPGKKIKIIEGPSLPAEDRVFTLSDLPEEDDDMPFFIEDADRERYVCDPSEPIEDGCLVLARTDEPFIARLVKEKGSLALVPLGKPMEIRRYKCGMVKLQRLTMRVEMLK